MRESTRVRARHCCRPAFRPHRRSRQRDRNLLSESALVFVFFAKVVGILDIFIARRILHLVGATANTIVLIHPLVVT
jgi:hypothetical protein